MFFVFGPSGQMYRGGPEQLSQVAPVRRVQRPQALRTQSADVQARQEAPTPAPGAQARAPAVPLRVLEAVSAYMQTEQGPAEPRQPLTRVRDVMTEGASTISVLPQLPAHEAWQLLAQQGIAQAPVVNAQGLVVGLLLRADLAPLELLPGREHVRAAIARAQRTVEQVMVTPVPTVPPETQLRRLAGVLLETGLPGLPVTDEAGRLAGFVSRADIMRAVAGEPPLDLWS
ncbi:histidine kinase [Melaminivora suipulveris]|uniref:Histidine kinase n=1 Tax=Melaminivora suipulveris TaxID=2109913 RepID=A0A2R3QEG0_9BURK|nr:CBS domain-containing protein [Melaminivora suipulveris]AVO50064.1 histidine kinase [Melaminivora suipulveris]